MRKIIYLAVFWFSFIFVLGCTKVKLETSKPIKIDIKMRVDVYQHIVSEVNDIEQEIYGESEQKLNLFRIGEEVAYAYEERPPEVKEAILSRKKRASLIEQYQKMGYIGENEKALLVVMKDTPQDVYNEVEKLVEEENRDRMVIYKYMASKNNVPLEQIQEVFFNKHYQLAPQGSWFKIFDKEKEGYVWKKK